MTYEGVNYDAETESAVFYFKVWHSSGARYGKIWIYLSSNGNEADVIYANNNSSWKRKYFLSLGEEKEMLSALQNKVKRPLTEIIQEEKKQYEEEQRKIEIENEIFLKEQEEEERKRKKQDEERIKALALIDPTYAPSEREFIKTIKNNFYHILSKNLFFNTDFYWFYTKETDEIININSRKGDDEEIENIPQYYKRQIEAELDALEDYFYIPKSTPPNFIFNYITSSNGDYIGVEIEYIREKTYIKPLEKEIYMFDSNGNKITEPLPEEVCNAIIADFKEEFEKRNIK